jgi:hypothetical protein
MYEDHFKSNAEEQNEEIFLLLSWEIQAAALRVFILFLLYTCHEMRFQNGERKCFRLDVT